MIINRLTTILRQSFGHFYKGFSNYDKKLPSNLIVKPFIISISMVFAYFVDH